MTDQELFEAVRDVCEKCTQFDMSLDTEITWNTEVFRAFMTGRDEYAKQAIYDVTRAVVQQR